MSTVIGFIVYSGQVVNMSAAYDDALTTCNELVNLQPDISVLCHDISTTNSDCVDIKPEIGCVNRATSSSRNQSDCKIEAAYEQFDVKSPTCVMCDKLHLLVRDEKLHQIPLVLMDEFDITKLVYPLLTSSQASEILILNEKPSNRRYICIECGQGLCTIAQWKVHTMRHSGGKPFQCTGCHQQFWYRKQLLTHSTVECRTRRVTMFVILI